MARLVVATVPLTGHVHPMLLLVRELVARGHEVHWHTSRKFAPAIEETGARYVALQATRDWADVDIARMLGDRRGISRVKAQLVEMFIAPMLEQLHDLEALAGTIGADAVLADSAHLGAALLAEKHSLPWIGLGISALMIPSRDTAPFGSAMPPPKNDVERAIHRWVGWLVHRGVFRDVNTAYRRRRVEAGLPAGEGTYFDVLARDLFLQPTVPAFEYPRSDLPSQVQFIGPLVPKSVVSASALPSWWGDVEEARSQDIPIVLVTQGTLATDARELIQPTLAALRDAPVLVIATTPATIDAPPANARLAPYVPYEALLPRLSAMVTNGGYGGVQMALAHGVPLVVAGGSEEKPEIAARVAWSGAGIDLRTGRPRGRAIRSAVTRVLAEPAFRARAQVLAADIATTDAASTGAALIEKVVGEASRSRTSGAA